MTDPTPPAATASASPAPGPTGPTLLEDVLLALQKTFSRLSATTGARSAEEFRGMALALIVGDVNFEITLNVAPIAIPGDDGSLPKRPDNLRYCADGSGFPLKLAGRIATDVRHAEAPAATRTGTDGAAP